MGKLIIKIIVNSIIGIGVIYVINKIGMAWNFHIGFNVFTAIFVRNIGGSWSNFNDNF